MSRSPEQNNRCPVAITLEVRPRRRRVYTEEAMKENSADHHHDQKEVGQAVSPGCLSMAILSLYMLHASSGVCRCALCYVAVEQKVRVNKASRYKTALPKALREA